MDKTSVETDKVLRVSLPGKDVDSTNMLDFAVHSGFDYPKIEENMVGFVSFTFPGTVSIGETTITTVTHNYGYKPMSIAFLGDVGGIPSDTFSRLPMPIFPNIPGSFVAYTTNTEFKIIANIVDEFAAAEVAGKTYTFKYQVWIND